MGRLRYSDKTMYGAVREACEKHPTHAAYRFLSKETSYPEFVTRVDALASAFFAVGISKGDKVLILSPNIPQSVEAVYAVNKIGGVVALIHPLSAENELVYYMGDTDAKAVVCLSQNLPMLLAARKKAERDPLLIVADQPTCDDKNVLGWKTFSEGGTGNSPTETDKDAPAVIFYSGGTTGKPKGVLLSSYNLNVLALQTEYACGCVPMCDYSALAVIPIFHGFGFGVSVHMMLSSGGLTILIPKFSAKDFADLLLREKPNIIAGVPTLYNALLMAQDMDGEDFSFVKGIFAGGDALPEKLKNNVDAFLKAHNCDVVLREGYGLTETVTACCLTPATGAKKGSIGLPFDDTVFRICKPNTEEELPIGERGEICITGPSVMLGYLNNPEETDLVLHRDEGGTVWLHTGDLAYMDEDGFVYFVQRIKRMIVSSGYNVFPSELEKILNLHPLIAESCCIGIDDAYRLKKVKAFLVLKDKANAGKETEEKILAYCAENMAKYAVPSVIEFIDELPHTKVGKVAFAELEKREKEKERESKLAVSKEEALRIAVRETLGVDSLKSVEDFFRAGGNSVKIFILLTKIKKYGYELSLRDFSSAKSEADILKAMRVGEEDTAVTVAREQPSEEEREEMREVFGEEVSSVYPLTPMQEAIYFQLEERNSNLYNTLITVECGERLDDNLFGKATELLAERYPVLKTGFFAGNNTFWQCIVPSRKAEHSVRNGNVEEIAQEEWGRSFAVGKDVLLRMILVHDGEKDYILQNGHHIVIDGVSQTLLFVAFADIYRQLKEGIPEGIIVKDLRAASKKDLPFEEYVYYLRGKDKQKGLEYYRRLLDGYTNGVVKIDGSSLAPKMGDYSTKYCVLPEKDAKDIADFAKKEGITVGMLFKAVWSILLQKYTYTEDLVFGEVHRGRAEELSGITDAVGMFINTVPVRLHVDADKSMHDFFSEIREQNIRSNPYLTVALSDINAQITQGAVVGTLLNFQDNDVTSYHTGSEGFKRVKIRSYNNFELEFEVTIGEERCAYNICYNNSVYTDEDIERLTDRIMQAFRSIIRNPQAKIGEIDVLSEKERQELDGFNATDFDYDENLTVVQRFENQVALTPNLVALDFYDRQISYREMDEQADYLAEELMRKGIRKGDVVAVYMRRCPEMIIALYGILKCGGVYLPLDETYPVDRLEFVVKDSGSSCVVCGKDTVFPLDFPVVNDWEGKKGKKTGVKLYGKDDAYIIYTSGTTGKPKGVQIAHKGFANLMYAYEKIYALKPTDVVLQVASYTFDQSVWDIFGVLCIGGRLVLINEDDVHDPERIASYSNQKGVTIASFTPAMVAELDPDAFDTLRILDTSGEAASATVLKRWIPTFKVINTYGPTECTVNTCSYSYDGMEPDNVPIGGPLYNTRFFVLDKGNRLCGVGMNGELCIAGDGLSKGYLHRPELTAEKFVPSVDGKGVMYRSGDLTAWRNDGVIRFWNRLDGQIKIRGFRIELGEIDSVLRAIPEVKDCYVGVFTFTDAKAVAGYVVTDGDPEKIKEQMRAKLPEYMVPQYLIKIERVPRSLAGKVDRKLLPLPQRMESNHTPLESKEGKVLKKAVYELLACEKLYGDDDFFELGGDSIKAIRLVTKLRSFGYKITVKDVMNLRLLGEISKNMVQEKENPVWTYPENPKTKEEYGCAEISDIDFEYIREKFGENVERIYPLTPLQQGMVYHAMEEGEFPEYVTQRVLKAEAFSRDHIREATELLTTRFEVLRTAFVEGMSGDWQVIVKNRVPEILFTSGNVDEIAEEDLLRGFDLENDCLFRLTFVDEGYVIQTAHHAIVDGWSEEIIWNAFKKYDRLLRAGKDFGRLKAMARRENLAYPRFEQYVASMNAKDKKDAERYFHTLLDGFAGATYFPAKSGKYDVELKRALEMKEILSPKQSERIHAAAKGLGITFPLLCQVIWGIALARFNGKEEAVFGNVYSGRDGETSQTGNMVGMYINTIPVRVKAKGKVFDLLKSVAEQIEESIEKGYVSLAKIGAKFDTICVFTNTGDPIDNVYSEIDQTNYNFEWEITDGESISTTFRYNGDLYSEEEIRRLVVRLKGIFRQIVQGVTNVEDIEVDTDDLGEGKKDKKKKERKHERPQGREIIVARIVRGILGGETVYADDDFFDLGGDSIGAVRLSARLKGLGYEIKLRDITKHRTVRAIAEVMQYNADIKTEERRRKYQKIYHTKEEYGAFGISDADFESILAKYGNQVERIYPVVSLQEGMIYHSLEDNAYITQSIVKIKRWDERLVRECLILLSVRYEVLRTAFVSTESGNWQVVVKDRLPDVEFIENGDVRAIAKEQYERGFDLENDILFRVVFVTQEQECTMIQTAHHAILDGWSEDVLWKTYGEYYQALEEGKPFEELKKKAQEDNLNNPRFEEFVLLNKNKNKDLAYEYFRSLLYGFEGTVYFPSLTEEIGVELGIAKEKSYTFSTETSEKIRKFALQNEVTVPVLLETVWGIMLGRATGAYDAVLGNVISGRSGDIVGMDEMVGLFINTVPVRVRSIGYFREILKDTAEQILDTESYAYIPFSDTGAKIGTVCVFENYGTEDMVAPEEEYDQTNYDLEWEIRGKEKITFILRYNGGLYTDEEMQRVSEVLQKAIVTLCEKEDVTAEELITFTPEEQEGYRKVFLKEKEEKIDRKEEAVQGEREEIVAKCFKELLCIHEVFRDDDFFLIGGDSIKAIRLSAKLRGLGYEITVKEITAWRTVRDVAEQMKNMQETVTEEENVYWRSVQEQSKKIGDLF